MLCRPHAGKQALIDGAHSGFECRITVAEASTHGLDLLLGEVHFVAPETVEIQLKDGETQQITAPLIFIDVGLRTYPLTITGVERVPVLDSTSIMEMDTLPYPTAHHRQRLHRAGIRPDVLLLRQSGHAHPAQSPPAHGQG
jgi:hypothetical protein